MTGIDTMTTDHPVVKAMQEINPAFMSAASRLGVSVAQEGLGNVEASKSYETFLALQPGSSHDALIDDARRRLAKH